MSAELARRDKYSRKQRYSDDFFVIEVNRSRTEVNEDKETPRGWSRLNLSVEPLLFSLTFMQTFSQGVLLNLVERNACSQKYNLTQSECLSGNYINPTMKSYLEGTVAEISQYIHLIQGLCPVVLSLFIGPWSDHNGRKLFITLPFAGYFLYYLLWGLLSFFPEVPVRYMLIPSIPVSLTGGLVAELVCCYCYLCDMFPPETRAIRFNLAMSAFLCGSLLANLTVPRVFALGGEYGFALVFFVSSTVSIFSFLYSWLCLKETVEKVEGKGFLFHLDYAKSVLTTLVIRPLDELAVILLTVVILVAEILLKAGEGSIEYLVGKSQFSWSLKSFTQFSSYNTIIAVFCSVLGSLILKRMFNLKNSTVIFISALSLSIAEVIRGFSYDERMYWISTGLSKTGALVGPTIAAEMSNVVSTEDLGKVYAFNALIESSSAFLSTPVYTALYKHLVPAGDSLQVYFLSAGFSTIIILAAVCLSFINRWYKEDSYCVSKY